MFTARKKESFKYLHEIIWHAHITYKLQVDMLLCVICEPEKGGAALLL